MTWEAVVRDVCETCNNGPLSTLDKYARDFLTSVNYKRTYEERATVQFEYDYQLLLRWLLKVSFNAARGLSKAPPLLRDARSYIRSGEGPPAIAFLALEVVRDAPMPDGDRSELPLETRNWRFIPTKMFRAGPGTLIPPSAENASLTEHCLRFVAVNAWQFYMCLVDRQSTRSDKRRLVRLFSDLTPDAVFLNAPGRRSSVKVSHKTGLESYEFQGRRVANQWLQYVKETADRAE